MSMFKKKVCVIILCTAILLLAASVINAAGTYHMPSKHKGLSLGVKIDPKKLQTPPCAQFGCTAWHTAVGDKDSKKVYRCGCNIPSALKKEKAVCFMSSSAGKKAGYREEMCRR